MDTKQNIRGRWVTKFVTEKEWREYYCDLSYSPVKKVKGGMRMGFLIAGIGDVEIPADCIEASEDDLRVIRRYRESANLSPLPEVLNPYPS